MAMVFQKCVIQPDGSQVRIAVPDAKRFSHYVKNVRFWFAYHFDQFGNMTVSHWDSGARVCLVSIPTRQACLGGDKGAAKLAIDNLCKEKGADRVHGILQRAETMGY